MAVASPSLDELQDADRAIVEGWLIEFERAWDDRALARAVSRLPAAGDPLRLPAIVEMVRIDLERQWSAGRCVLLESYLRGYPELAASDSVVGELIEAECEVRRQFGESPSRRGAGFQPAAPAELARRFPDHAAHPNDFAQNAAPTEPPAEPAARDTALPRTSTHSIARPAPKSAPLPERFGRYRILRELGSGGMGSVYLAEDTQLERRVALKIPHFRPEDGPEVLERFLREARAAATLSHPNLCPVFEVGEIDGTHYLAMEYIEGRPLSHYIRPEKPVPPRQAAAVVRKLALALHEAHERGVLHRDLKPSNVMINHRREPVIMDFGLARRTQHPDKRLTQSGLLLGTPAYMPPEQVRGELEALGPTCDIYSLGVILYELLTGRLPFEGPFAAVLAQVLTQDAPLLREHCPDIDAELEAICLKLMAKSADDRYASMQEAAEALAPWTRRSGSGEQSERQASRPCASALPTVTAARDEALVSFLAMRPEGTNAVPGPRRNSPLTRLSRQLQRMPRRTKAVATSVLAGLLLLMTVIVLLRTPTGLLKVEVIGDDVKVLIDGDRIMLSETGRAARKLPATSHDLALRIGNDVVRFDVERQQFALGDGRVSVTVNGVELKSERFEVVRNDETVLKIAVVPNQPSQPTAPASVPEAGSGKQYALRFHRAWPGGDSGSANKGTDHIRVSNFKYDGTHPLTLEAIVTPMEFEAPGTLCAVLSNEKLHESGITLEIESGTRHWRFVADAGAHVYARSEWPVALHHTYHLAAILDGDRASLYVDGELQRTRHVLRRPYTPSGLPLLIGNVPKSATETKGYSFSGWIHAVRVSRIARYDQNFNPPTTLDPDADSMVALTLNEGVGETAIDGTGNNHHGVIVGARWGDAPKDLPMSGVTTPVPRANEVALRFDGAQHLKPGYLALPGGGTFTVEAFVRASQHADNEPFDLVFGCEGTGFALGMGWANGCARWTVYEQVRNGNLLVADEPAALLKRTHLAVVFDRGNCRLFVNGWRQSATVVMKFSELLKPVIGAQIVGGKAINHFNGLIEQVRFSSGALYQNDFAPSEILDRSSDTLAVYRLDEGGKSIIHDDSGNSHNLVWDYAPWVHTQGWAAVEVVADEQREPPATFNGHYYAVVKQKLPWGKAKAFCDRLGGRLLVVDSPEEWEFVRKIPAESGLRSGCWVGAEEAGESAWQWLGGAVVDNFWAAGKPDHLQGDDDYAICMDSYQGWALNDVPRHLWFPCICEWDGAPSAEELDLLEAIPPSEDYTVPPDAPPLWRPQVRLRAYAPGGDAPLEVQNVRGGVRVTPDRGTLPAVLTVETTGPQMCEYSFDLVQPNAGERRKVTGTLFPKPWTVKYYSWETGNTPTAEQWHQMTSGTPLLVEERDQIAFNWGRGAPAEGVPADRFAIVAETDVELPEGKYEVRTSANDTVRVVIDGERLIDNWNRPGEKRLYLGAGLHTFRIEYYEINQGADLNVAFRRISSDYFPAEWTLNCYLSGPGVDPLPTDDQWRQIVDGVAVDTFTTPNIQFVWEGWAPTSNVPADYFAIVAHSKVDLPQGRYRITTEADDGVRVFVDDRKVHDVWRYPGPFDANSDPFELEAGEHSIRIEYCESYGSARLKFELERLE